ncbi:MAG: hypothetical protein B6I22_12505 [Desulfobacteraceae bacterium 4572_123]|nr:MAG: hypothetical protein B6I22_12505 [Desulfobacteraceae bacterium 4572_123]
MILNTMSVEGSRVLMVGDKLSTDIVGAGNAGLTSVLVKTGEFRESDLDNEIKPDFIFDHVGQLRRLFE